MRGIAWRVADYWQPIDEQNFVAWQKLYVKTNFLLFTCDEDKRQQEIEMTKTKADSEAATSAQAMAAYQARSKASEVIDIKSPLVMTANGIMKNVSEVIELPPASTCTRGVNMNKDTG